MEVMVAESRTPHTKVGLAIGMGTGKDGIKGSGSPKHGCGRSSDSPEGEVEAAAGIKEVGGW